MLFFHRSFDLVCNDTLNGNCFRLLQQIFFCKKIIKARTNMFFLFTHRIPHFNLFILFRAISKSSFGVFCDFFINPCSKIIKSASVVNRILAIPSLKCERTSQIPFSSLRTNGIPIGHPYWTVLMSSPIVFLYSTLNDLSQSRTGSAPLSVR